MSLQQGAFLRFIKLLSDNDLLEHVILIGSWAEFIYKEAGILPGFEGNIKTLDIDFLLKNLRKPTPAINLETLAREEGYLVENDILDGATRIMDKQGLEIEFLINKKGAGLEETLRGNMGVTAQALRHLNILKSNTIEVKYLSFKISVPIPEAYTIHKMVINDERGIKRDKDAKAIQSIWPFIDKEAVQEIYIKTK
ncbi:MAG: nucleotidyltransferase domain-containing protein [Clostridia bacterium]|nr:nucleotidyltransferase domain-containing protein [Clostridia bacterium]